VEDTLLSLAHGFGIAFQPDNLWYAFLGCLVGTLVGVLPGIGPLSGISILLPVTFGLNATQAVIMLAGIYYGSQYGGSTTSILMRIPGEASSVMTCIAGHDSSSRRSSMPQTTGCAAAHVSNPTRLSTRPWRASVRRLIS